MIVRAVWPQLKQDLEKEGVLVLTGARQVGKTTTLKWLLSQIPSTNKFYFDLENVANRDLFTVNDYDQILEELNRLNLDTKQRLYIALDEIQLLPMLPSVIKYLQDHYPIKFLTSGSSSYYLKNLFSESLAGRKKIYELFPLTFSEFLAFKGIEHTLPHFRDDLPFSTFSYDTLAPYYDEYIKYGGVPKVVMTKSFEEKKELLQLIYSSYITIDVQSLADFKSLTDFRRLVALLAARIGNKVNISQLAATLGISRQTVDAYLSFMEQTYLIRLVPAFSTSVDISTRMAQKIYFVDTGIANIQYELSSGAQFENTVCHQLFQYANKRVLGRDMFYYTHRQSEVDFIVNNIAFEVKETPSRHDVRKLKRNTASLKLSRYRLIGKKKSAQFNDFIWGGLIE